MKLPTLAKLRFPILIVLAICEAIGLRYFYRTAEFRNFAILSLDGLVLTIPLLWIDSLRRRGLSGFNIFIAVLAGINSVVLLRSALNYWDRGEKALAVVSAEAALFIAIVILFKLIFPGAGLIAKDAIAFIGYSVMVVWIWPSNAYIQWKVVSLIPLLWFAWRVVFHIRRTIAEQALTVEAHPGSEARER
jgi:hypothetical protein